MENKNIELLVNRIAHPQEGFDRTQALRELMLLIDEVSADDIRQAAFDTVSSIKTEDQLQSVLIGITLFKLNKNVSDIGILARIFPGLTMTWEPQFQNSVKEIFLSKSPKSVFEDITEMVGNQSGSDADLFYGYNVISKIDYDKIKE